MLVLGLIILSRWWWDAKRAQREDEQQHEPRANPPLHDKFATKQEHTALAKKMDEELGRERGARKLIHQEIAALQTGVATIEAKTDSQTEQLGELKQQIDRTSERIDLVPERTIKLLGETQRLHRTQ